VPGEKVALRMRWTIASLPDGAAVAVEESRIEQPIASASYADLVAAESAALGAVTRQIAERLASLPEPAQSPAYPPSRGPARARVRSSSTP
jgi:uncharacterized lipoprotein YmbA